MAYTVLARRYRSSTFDEVVGQDHVAQTLKKAIESGRIAHAYLFCGTRGVGKTSMARIMAKALNCRKFDAPTTTPCGKCNSCVAIARGDDIDVIEIDAASNTGVDNVRDLISNAQFRPAASRFKVYIIDEVHMLSKSAFNALLKTLEEPPEHVKFILATTEPEKVLPTILSRCQRYDFRNIPSREIAEHLKEICKNEKIKADDDALLLVAKAGAGSMRDSLSMLDRLLSVGEKQITVELIEQTLGMPPSQAMFDLAEHIGSGDVKKTLETADKLINGGLSSDTLVLHLADHFRNLLIVRTCGPKSNLVEVPGISIDELAKQAEKFDAVALTQDIAILEDLRRNLRLSQAGRAILDAALVRLSLAEQFSTVEQLLGQVNGGMAAAPVQKKKLEPEVIPTAPAPAAPPQTELEPVDPKDLTAVWNRLLGELSAKSPSLPALLSTAKLVGFSDGQAVLRYPHDQDTVVKILERNGKKDVIRDVLGSMLNQTIGLKFEFDQAPPPSAEPVEREPQRTPARQTTQPPAPRVEVSVRITDEMRQQLRQDDLINAVIENLGGEIVKVE